MKTVESKNWGEMLKTKMGIVETVQIKTIKKRWKWSKIKRKLSKLKTGEKC